MSVHIAGSVWWPPPPVALEQVSTAPQPGTSRATGGGGHHTEPLMCLGRSHWTLSSGELYLVQLAGEECPHRRSASGDTAGKEPRRRPWGRIAGGRAPHGTRESSSNSWRREHPRIDVPPACSIQER